MGNVPFCVSCGEILEESEYLNCDNCRNVYCEGCGSSIHPDDGIYLGDYFYCLDCVSSCADCDEMVINDNLHEVHDQIYVCSYCFNKYYQYCEECSEYHHEDYIHYTNIGTFCNHCYEYNIVACTECGNEEYGGESKGEYIDGDYYCFDCFEKLQEEECA